LPRGARQHVLVVDDDESLVKLTAENLAELGYVALPFTSSAAALQAFRAQPEHYDAVIMDERMPGLSGTALIGLIREIRGDIPALLISGNIGVDFVQNARQAGAFDVLKKPLRLRELATALHRALHSGHQQR
jgi:DNA-binding NtrC family response regulator